jgi:phage tail sheath protein FI
MAYGYPGVYVEETATGPRPIESVGVSTPAFIGTAPKASEHRGKPKEINNWSQFVKEFTDEGPGGAQSTHLSHAVFGFFANGGRRCIVVDVGGKDPTPADASDARATDIAKALDALASNEEVALVVAPGVLDEAIRGAIVDHCRGLRDRVALLDGPASENDISEVVKCAKQVDGGYAALYSPWIEVLDPLASKRTMVYVPPTGHIAGVIARIDALRGVHKAPANEVIQGALGIRRALTPGELEIATKEGINAIRVFPADYPRIWGARTLAKEGEWRYLNVRRLFIMVRESVQRSMRWVVFEPNDRTLWNAIKRDVRAYLMRLWREGALMGATPEQAFFVKCDEETNPPEEIDAGRVTTIIGLAPVKPAEFVVFKIGQHVGGAEVEEEGNRG